MAAPGLLLDVHVHYGACGRLQEGGFDVVHAADEGLAESDDVELLLAAAEDHRIVVAWNYQHFAPLVDALAARGEAFPGVLFLSPSIPRSDPSGHVRAIRRWYEEAGDENPIESTCGWIDSA